MSAPITVCRSARLTPAAYQFYCAILRTFPARGTPPEPAALGQLAERFAVPLVSGPAGARGGDPGGRNERIGQMRQQVFAMCALDALGILLMLRRKATIVSHDALTKEPVEVHIAPAGDASLASLATLAGWSALGSTERRRLCASSGARARARAR